MSINRIRSRRRKPHARRTCGLESLESRLALSADLAFAGAFEVLGGSTSSMYSSPYDLTRGGGLVTDTVGNRYVTINSTADHVVDLDPGPGVSSVTTDSALVKLSPTGNLLWAAPLNTSGAPVRILHAVDANQNVYLVGDFRGTVDLNPGPGVTNVTSTANGSDYGYYMAKLNSAGQLTWARSLNANELTPYRVDVDIAGNLIVACQLTSTVSDPPTDVDPGPGQVLVPQAASGSSSVLLKYDSNGDYVWHRQFGGSEATLQAIMSVTADATQDIYFAGRFSGSLDLDPGPGVHIVTHESDTTLAAFIVRLDANGGFEAGYATEGDGSAAFLDLEAASDGSVVAGGYFKETVDFEPGSGSLPLTWMGAYTNALAIKLNSDFSIAWAKGFGSPGEALASELDVDADGNIYLGGSFGRLSQPNAIYDFDPGPGVYELARPAPHECGFVLSLTATGDFRWAVPLGGNAGAARVQGVSVTADGSVQLSGAFKGTADFDPDPDAEYWLNSGITQGVFVATLSQVEPDPGAPTVDAGASQAIVITGTANLDGSIADDGLPNPLTTTWSLQSGPGIVVFGNASAVDTTAQFSAIGTYLLKLEASDGLHTVADFVQVTVNPLTTSLTATADTYIDAGSSTTNFGTSASIIVDGKPDDGALLKWDLSSIPAGSTIQSVTLSINVTNTSADVFEIYDLKRNWVETQATWKKFNSSTNWQSAGAKGTQDRGSTVLGMVTASVAGASNIGLNAAGVAVVQGWINNSTTNFGLTIQDYANGSDDDLAFSSRNAAVASQRPQLVIVYTPPAAAQSQGLAVAGAEGGAIAGSSLVFTSDAIGGKVNAKASKKAEPAESPADATTLLLTTQTSRRLAKAADHDRAFEFLADEIANSNSWYELLDDGLLLDFMGV